MTEIWRQERPTWCPHKDCAYRVSTQAVACLGELPNPTDHDGTPNTHRFCMRGASDDGEWLFKLELNQGDAAALVRIFSACFGLKASSLSASPEGRTEVSADHPLAKALRASPETVERIRRMDEQNAIAAARSKDFIVGSSSASPAVGEEDKRPFLNRVRSLFNIDGSLLPELTAEQQREFIRDPVRYFIGTDKVQSDAIWREVLRRNV